LTRSIESAAQVFGGQSLMANQYKSRLGLLLALRGDIGPAVQSMKQANEVLQDIDKSRSVASALRLRAFGRVLLWAGRPTEALAVFEQARAILAERSDARSLVALDGDAALALLDLGRVVEAESLLVQAMRTGAALTPPEELSRAFGRLLVAQGKPLEAIGTLERAVTTARQDPRRFFAAETLSDLALAQIEAGLPASAVERLDEALSILGEVQSSASPSRALALQRLGSARLDLLQAEAALEPLQQADAFWNDFDPDNRQTGVTAFWLGRCYAALGRTNDAKKAYSRAAKILANSQFPGDTRLVQLARRG
jgi:tetratricopeptide (TPR) repeat protein